MSVKQADGIDHLRGVCTPEKEEFAQKNLGLVHACANRFRGRGIEYDDLYGAGCIGLLKAMDGFDVGRGLRFSTYAVPVILGEIKRLFRDGGAIKVSRSLKELSLRVSRERERYMKQHFKEPTVSELAQVLQVTPEEVAEAFRVSLPPLSLTVKEEDGEQGVELDIAVDEIGEAFSERFALKEEINQLSQQDKQLIQLRYYQGKTQTQTAKVLGITQVQVSRREKKILTKLRDKLA